MSSGQLAAFFLFLLVSGSGMANTLDDEWSACLAKSGCGDPFFCAVKINCGFVPSSEKNLDPWQLKCAAPYASAMQQCISRSFSFQQALQELIGYQPNNIVNAILNLIHPPQAKLSPGAVTPWTDICRVTSHPNIDITYNGEICRTCSQCSALAVSDTALQVGCWGGCRNDKWTVVSQDPRATPFSMPIKAKGKWDLSRVKNCNGRLTLDKCPQ